MDHGEFISDSKWLPAVASPWFALSSPGARILEVVTASPSQCPSRESILRIADSFEELKGGRTA
jgi:hypothetical protein